MSDEEKKEAETKTTITVGGVTFSADQVKSAVVEIDGREVCIGEKDDEPRGMGFK